MASSMKFLRRIELVTGDRVAGVDDEVAVCQRDWEEVQWAWSRAADDFAFGVVQRTVARAVELFFVSPPGHSAAQMRAALPQG